jgi:hypothetical protein
MRVKHIQLKQQNNESMTVMWNRFERQINQEFEKGKGRDIHFITGQMGTGIHAMLVFDD